MLSIRPCLVLSLVTLAITACTSTSPNATDSSKSTGSSGGTSDSTDGTSDDHGCAAACAAYEKAGCSNQTGCLDTCAAGVAKCPKEMEALAKCIPTSSLHCASNGNAVASECDDEGAAFVKCRDAESSGGDPTAIPCTPHRASGDDAANCTGDCTKSNTVATGGVMHTWCTSACTTDSDCDEASGKTGVYACAGVVCMARCENDSDCSRITGSSGCADHICY